MSNVQASPEESAELLIKIFKDPDSITLYSDFKELLYITFSPTFLHQTREVLARQRSRLVIKMSGPDKITKEIKDEYELIIKLITFIDSIYRKEPQNGEAIK